jgi:hypothetical protein
MSLLRRLVPLAVGVLATVGVATAIGAPAGATGSPGYNEQAVLVLDRPAIPVGGTNTATIQGCKPGTEVPFVLRTWDRPGNGQGPDNGLGDGTLWLGTAIVGPDGSASLTFTLPDSIRPGTFAVKAMCDLPHGYSGWLATRMQVTGPRGPQEGRSNRSAVEGAEVLSASASAGSPGGSAGAAGGSSSGGVTAAATSDTGSSPLARTGLDLAGVVRLGVILLALGGAVVLVTRKRRLTVGL